MPYYGTQGKEKATIWEHLKVAFDHQQSLLGPHGGYLSEATGDWNDFSTEFEHMTESMLVTAQLAYAYPQAGRAGRPAGRPRVRRPTACRGAEALATMRQQWTGKGWYSRGYSGAQQIGQGVIFEEPQPWAILAGAPTGAQANTLVRNIRRYPGWRGRAAQPRGPGQVRHRPGSRRTTTPA